MPFLLHLSVRGCCFSMFCFVFLDLNAIFICVSLKSFIIFLVSFPLCVTVSNFVFLCCGSIYVFLFCGAGKFFILFTLWLLCIVFL
jgi:hypothetical protein